MNSLKIHITIFSILLVFLFQESIAQDPMFNHYTEDRELPSNEVYGLALDNNNVIYMVTDRGLVVYDGYEFKTYSTKDNLKDNCLLRINKDKDGRLWLTSLQNTANYIENGVIYTAGFSDALASIPKKNEDFVQHVFISSNGDTLINFNFPGIFRATEAGKMERVTDHFENAGDANICLFQTDQGFYWDLIHINDTPAPEKKSSIRRNGNRYYLTTPVGYNNKDQRKEFAQVSDTEFYFSYCNRLFHILNDSIAGEYDFEHDILDLFYDKISNDLWLGVEGQGALRYQDCLLESGPTIYLKGQGVSTILRDHEKNYWFSVRDNGVFMAHSLDHIVYNINHPETDENRITAILPIKNQLLFGTYSGKLFSLKKNQEKSYRIEPFNHFQAKSEIRQLIKTKQNTVLVLAESLFELDEHGNLTGFKEFATYPYSFLELNGDTCVLSHSNGLLVYQGRKKLYNLNNHPGYFRVTNMNKETPDKIWLSSRANGVFTWDGKNEPVKFKAFPDFGIYRSNAFEQFNNATLISPYGYGLYIMSKTDTISIAKQLNGLSGNMIDNLMVEKGTTSKQDSLIWVSTNQGITIISFPGGLSEEDCETTVINTASGLPSNRIFQVAEFDGYIWAATGRGLVRLSHVTTGPSSLIKPMINQVYVNDEVIVYDSDSTLQLDSGYPYTLRFSFKTISYQQPHKVYYYYYLDGIDDPNENWAMTSDTEIRYTGLRAGAYSLFIQASRSPNLKLKGPPADGTMTSEVDLVISPKLYHRLGFQILFLILALLLVTLITRKIIKAIKTREENKQRLLQAEKQALLSQMNPHFIFNSLNSIQHYIIEQDSENANLYLAKFSQLIRRILENSKKKWISLREEIETITLYLNLEKLRFEDNFDFKILPDKKLDQLEIMIPPMMVQPFIENAIWHGIMPLKGKGYVTISYEADKNRMKVVIEDNGIGREQASKRKRIAGHIPTGLRNVNERIILLNKIMKEPISCNIIDRKHKNGKSAGTRVELSVPIMHLKN